MTMAEVADASAIIADAADPDANIIFGATIDESMNNKVKVSVIATGFADKMAYNQRSMFGAYGRSAMKHVGSDRTGKTDEIEAEEKEDRIDRAPEGWVQPMTKSQVTGGQTQQVDDATSPFIQSAAFDDSTQDDTKQTKKAKKSDKDQDDETPPELPSDDFDDEFEIPAFLRQRK
ncbi:MAG: Cell division protein FtsZ [Candidatus Pacebacteria bacterium GW2011_GWB1_47_8]|nr:MAG: Cell division protein FtsZ [Candidatus Pacebacteria bacterium GW2011_GWB1_47_8]